MAVSAVTLERPMWPRTGHVRAARQLWVTSLLPLSGTLLLARWRRILSREPESFGRATEAEGSDRRSGVPGQICGALAGCSVCHHETPHSYMAHTPAPAVTSALAERKLEIKPLHVILRRPPA
ncbi:hypothetical protein AAFF_G00327620 [Aldrovandia affinis]|uniref:Uncharacterized protein n=1 Tax=Aldrovandia affinis TaxID=143900 RepID=A0AAD7T9I0_9TELE|nr:hypothetical protein AAFF_G00327620 [Aldrovandia affinis]